MTSEGLERIILLRSDGGGGGGGLVVADHWFRQVERVLESMEITSDMTRIRLPTFLLEGESQVWWDWV